MKAFPCPPLPLTQESITQNAQAKLGLDTGSNFSYKRQWWEKGGPEVKQEKIGTISVLSTTVKTISTTSPCFGAICKTEMLIIPHISQLFCELTHQGSVVFRSC